MRWRVLCTTAIALYKVGLNIIYTRRPLITLLRSKLQYEDRTHIKNNNELTTEYIIRVWYLISLGDERNLFDGICTHAKRAVSGTNEKTRRKIVDRFDSGRRKAGRLERMVRKFASAVR